MLIGIQSRFNDFTAHLPVISRDTVKEYSKTAAKAIAILGASYLAYNNPFLFPLATAVTFIGSAYATTIALFNQRLSAELIHKIIAISITVFGLGLLGTTLGLLPYFSLGLFSSLKSLNVAGILFFSTIASALAGGAPLLKQAFDKGTSLLFESPPESLKNWVNNPLKNSYKLGYFFDRMTLFWSLALPNLSSNSAKIESLVRLIEKGEDFFKGSVELLDAIALYGSWSDKAEARRTLLPLVTDYVTGLAPDQRGEKLKQMIVHFERWNQVRGYKEPLVSSVDIKRFFERNSESYENLYRDFESLLRHSNHQQSYAEITLQIENLSSQSKPHRDAIQVVNKKLSKLRNKLVKLSKEIKLWQTVIVDQNWIHFDQSRNNCESFLSQHKQVIDQDFSALTNQTNGGETLLDKLQLITNRAASEEETLDLEDSVWNFLLQEGIATINELKSMTGKENPQEIDAFFEEKKIPTVDDLLTSNVLTREELKDKPAVKNKIQAYLATQSNQETGDLRSRIYTALGFSSIQAKLGPILQKIDQLAAPIFYRIAMAFVLLAPILENPLQGAAGLAIGAVYPLLNIFSWGQKLTKIAKTFVEGLAKARGIPLELFTRRSFLLNDPQTETDLQTWVKADTFGRLRIFSFESLIGLLTTIADIGNYDLEIPVGGIIQGFCLGKEISEKIPTLFV